MPTATRASPTSTRTLILVCQHGYQSSLAAANLQLLGFGRATDLDGGFEAWAAAGLPVTDLASANGTAQNG